MAEYSYIIGVSSLTVVIDGNPYIVYEDHPKFTEITKAIIDKASIEKILMLIDNTEIRDFVCQDKFVREGLVIKNGTAYLDDEVISEELADQITKHFNLGFPCDPIVNFIRKVRKNPSYRIREQLWKFIKACENSGGFTIAEDGDIIAYKIVCDDFMDIHSRQFDNTPGNIVEMPRRDVDDDPNNTCSCGLHFCAYSYLESYRHTANDRIILVKVNPEDVVSIPRDYNYSKARCCRYEVVQEVHEKKVDPVYVPDEEIRSFIAQHSNKNLTATYNEIMHTNRKKFKTKKHAEHVYRRDHVDLDLAKDIIALIELKSE